MRRKFLSRNMNLPFDLTERFTHDPRPLCGYAGSCVMSYVDMIVGDDPSAANRNYSAFQLSFELGKKEDLTCTKEQRATYFIGGICCLMPEVIDDIQSGLPTGGYGVRIVKAPVAARNGLVIPQKKANAFFGYLVIMLYKNVTQDNLRDLSDRHLKELFDAAGYAPSQGEDVSVFNGVRDALVYRCFGQYGKIKKSVLKGILNHSKDNDSFGNVCSYVAKTLSWIDMAGFYNVYKTLVLTDSPVLRSRELTLEVRNLQRAVEAVFDTEMPQYFRILENHSRYYLIERAKIRKLIAITEKIMMKTTHVTTSQFSASWLNGYVAMHKNHLGVA